MQALRVTSEHARGRRLLRFMIETKATLVPPHEARIPGDLGGCGCVVQLCCLNRCRDNRAVDHPAIDVLAAELAPQNDPAIRRDGATDAAAS